MNNQQFNDYLIFADEAGDHLLKSHYPEFPLFVLAFCIVKRADYVNSIVPGLLNIKIKYFPDTNVVFHERDIRKHTGYFAFLTDEKLRQSFFADINAFMEEAPFTVIASVINKESLQNNYTTPENPYSLGVEFGLEKILMFLDRNNQKQRATIAFEARGKKEDQELLLAIGELNQRRPEYASRFKVDIIPKISNNCGLQLADLIARPIGRYILDPSQPNRAYEIIRNKIDKCRDDTMNYGLKIFP